jgi:penicillin-binding protein 1C
VTGRTLRQEAARLARDWRRGAGRLARAWPRGARIARVVAIGVVIMAALFLLRVATTPLPPGLRSRASTSSSIRFVDRDGRALREVRADDAMRASWVALDDVGPVVVQALLAAEDQRFFEHPGVDPLAVTRAALSDATHARVVSGASTLTMQLARLVRPHRRTLLGKIDEAALALRIECSLGKRDILEQYVNRAPFGVGVRGIDAASRFWFDKAPRDLSLAEAATLAAIPRGPAVYAIDRHPERVVRRRDRILERMRRAGGIPSGDAERAEHEPLVAHLGKGGFGAPHLVAGLLEGLRGGVDPLWPRELGDAPAGAPERIETTIDGDLQREIERAAREQVTTLADKHVTAAAVIVLDNASGDVLAYVGSPDFGDDARGGQNDGVRALRQPGSTLKPFVYGLAMERLGWTAATVLPDVELRVAVPEGTYLPMNFDERYHGPVRLRDALGSSLNVPAVWTVEQLGIGPVLERLRALGFASLTRSDDWYGPALVLGDGEVTLLELARAYEALARGGTVVEPRAVKRVTRADGVADVAAPPARRVMPADVAAVLTDILSDSRARVAAFGERSALDLPFAVAAKTGTSKGSRDNWTVGFTREVTVAVWAGNFDGSAMRGTSGITGAAPIFHAAMEAAMRGRNPLPLRLADSRVADSRGADSRVANSRLTDSRLADSRLTDSRLADQGAAAGLVAVDVCPLSGGRPTAACGHSVREWMRPDAATRLAPCAMHAEIAVDERNGLRAGPSCPAAFVTTRTFERYDPTLTAWATAAGRPTAPDAFSRLCPGVLSGVGPGAPGARADGAAASMRIGWPRDGARFVLDPDRERAGQMLLVRVEAPANTEQVELRVDGRTAGRARAPFVVPWPLARGEHVMVALSSARATPTSSDPVTVVVQ